MSRFLTLILLGFAAYTLYKRIVAPPPPARRPPPADAQKICKCLQCNTHTPQSMGITDSKGQFFCSVEHQRLYLAARNKNMAE